MAVAAGQQWPGDRPRRGVRGGSPVATTMVRLRVCYLVHFCYTAWGSLRARWKPRDCRGGETVAAETVGDEATVIFDPLNGSMYGMATFGTLVKVRDYSDAGDYADGWALYRFGCGTAGGR